MLWALFFVAPFFVSPQPFASAGQVPSSVDSGVLVVSPVTAEVSVKAGESESAYLNISNNTRQAWTVRIRLLDERGSQKGSGVEVVERDDLGSEDVRAVATEWSRVLVRGKQMSRADTFVLDSGQRQEVEVKIAPPAEALGGGRAMRIIFVAEPLQESGGVGFQTSIASHVLITLKGRVLRRLEADFVPESSWSSDGRVKGRLTLRNLGHAIERIDARVTLDGIRIIGVGGESRRIQGYLLPAAQRSVPVEIRAERGIGIARAVPTLKSGKTGYPVEVETTGKLLYFVPIWLRIGLGLVVLSLVGAIIAALVPGKRRRYTDYENDWHDEDSDS